MRGFLGGSVVKSPPASAGDMGSIPDPGRSHMPESALEAGSLNYWSPRTLEPVLTTRESTAMNCTCSPQLEKTLHNKEDPAQPKINKWNYKNKSIFKKEWDAVVWCELGFEVLLRNQSKDTPFLQPTWVNTLLGEAAGLEQGLARYSLWGHCLFLVFKFFLEHSCALLLMYCL